MTLIIATAVGLALADKLREWWAEESADWDRLVESTSADAVPTDLWEDLPTIDSKAIARSSPIFEKHLGRPLDVKLIRRGGYVSIEDAIADLIPKMTETAVQQITTGGSKT